MVTSFFGWLAVVALIAAIFTHPIRTTANGPRVTSALLFCGLTSLGFYAVLNLVDFYVKGLVPMLGRGQDVVISAHPFKAYVVMGMHLIFAAACMWAGVWFLKIALLRRNKK